MIVTTRRGGFAALGQVLDLDVIPLSDAVRLLRTNVPDLDEDTGKQIAEELGRLPLALEQAAAYLDRSQMPASEYLELLRSRTVDLYQRGQVATRNDTIATLWDISLQRLSNENPAAIQLLAVCAYLAPEPIPPALFTAHPELLSEPLSSAAADPLAFADTLAALVDYSLAKRALAGLQVHRLVQATLRARQSKEPEASGWETGDPLAVALASLRANVPAEIVGAPQAWPKWAVLLPHVLAATGHLGGTAASSGQKAMVDAAWLLDRAGAYLQVHARLTDARRLLERALAIDEAAYGPDHPDVAVRLNNLATIRKDLGQPEEARSLQERALAITEAAYGPDHPDVAVRQSNLALILQDLGQPEEARSLQERALAITEAAYGPDHPDVAITLNNLALILQDLGQPEEAKRLQERALAINEGAYGPDHPAVAITLNSLASILRDLGEPETARPLLERALAIDETVFGPDHPGTATDLNVLALILRDLGEPETARPLLERALAINEGAYGPDHPAVAITLNSLASILQDLGEPETARPLLERALAITEVTLGPDHPTIAITLTNLASILQDLGELETARPLLERALAITEARE